VTEPRFKLTSRVPVQVDGLPSGVTEIAIGVSSACVVVAGGVRCWGENAQGELGNDSARESLLPVEVQGLTAGARPSPPPRRHLTGYFGVLSSHSSLRTQCVPAPGPETSPAQEDKSARTLPLSHYISWSDLLRRTFAIDTTCPRCNTPLRLIALIKTDDTIKKILLAMGLPTEAPKPCPARPPPAPSGGEGGDLLN
jgi:hypothetical protein